MNTLTAHSAPILIKKVLEYGEYGQHKYSDFDTPALFHSWVTPDQSYVSAMVVIEDGTVLQVAPHEIKFILSEEQTTALTNAKIK